MQQSTSLPKHSVDIDKSHQSKTENWEKNLLNDGAKAALAESSGRSYRGNTRNRQTRILRNRGSVQYCLDRDIRELYGLVGQLYKTADLF